MVHYWDYGTTSTDTGTYYNPRAIWRTVDNSTPTTTGTSAYQGWESPTASSTTGYYFYYTVVRKFLVDVPKHWGDPEIAGFTRLINDETKTGFKVDMVINGEIRVTDPNIERRDMAAFAVLLKSYASPADKQLIDKFFQQVPIEKPDAPASL